MTFQQPSDTAKVTRVFPDKLELPLRGLYLGERLAGLSAKIGRTLVITDFLSDRKGVIAKADEQGRFQVPRELRNASDWRLFQELMAQADVIISGAAYLQRLAALGRGAEDVLSQFEPGGEFEDLGEWRLEAGYENRSPDLAVVARRLEFNLPQGMPGSGRRTLVFTTDGGARSERARELAVAGAVVVGCGESGVDGGRMIDALSQGTGYRVVMMATGPAVLQLLLQADRLDIFYNTRAQVEIAYDDPSTVKTVLPGGKKVNELKEFGMRHSYLQEDAVTEDGSRISQLFLRYDRQGIF